MKAYRMVRQKYEYSVMDFAAFKGARRRASYKQLAHRASLPHFVEHENLDTRQSYIIAGMVRLSRCRYRAVFCGEHLTFPEMTRSHCSSYPFDGELYRHT